MNATDFIKEHGVEKARKVVEGAPEWAMSINFNNGMYYSRMEHKKGDTFLYDIKCLVESVDLINANGGLNGTKNTITLFQSSLDLGLYHGVDGVDAEVEIPRLKQAIADYELIYSNDMGDNTNIKNHVSPLCKVDELQKRVDALTLALDQIAYPIPHMQKEAELNGCELNGYWAVKMSEDHTYSKDIARRALEKEQALKGGSDE